MDGTNSAGRKVSLLNDHEPPQLARLPSFTPSMRSRTSSYASSASRSPPTPQLVRSHSSDSSTSMQTPSPITPDYYGEGLGSPVFPHQNGFFPQPQEPKEMSSAYPQLPHGSVALPYHAHPAQHEQAAYFAQQAQQASQEHHSATRAPPAQASAAASANSRPKKNQYPCPMAKMFNCTDHFTTSGHAARHAKKHTGKKDAVCPECNKAFTRKDNMEQHRRTHNTGRAHARTTERDAKKVKQRAQRPKPSPLQSSTPVMSPSVVDPSLPVSPTGSFMSQSVQPSESFVDFSSTQRSYPDPSTAYAMSYSYNPQSPSCGLDALAIAADGIDQRYEP